jgi:predicted transposase/invertase (TIGR01784 family)
MRHPIDPKVDCVFKALLGTEENRDLLIHFLNAMLVADLSQPIVDVDIIDAHNGQEARDDKLSVVDVKAKDSAGWLYQIEVQMQAYRHLPQRLAYTWCDIYSAQLRSGQDYPQLRPTYSIWLLAENLIRDDARYAHVYKLRDEYGRPLLEQGGIYLLELEKFRVERVETEGQRWLKFFKDAEALDEAALPDWMNTPEMRKAMNTLKQFSEKEKDYHAYQARQNYLREQRTIRWEYEQNLEAERRAKEDALREKQAALAEIERLKALLAQKP